MLQSKLFFNVKVNHIRNIKNSKNYLKFLSY